MTHVSLSLGWIRNRWIQDVSSLSGESEQKKERERKDKKGNIENEKLVSI